MLDFSMAQASLGAIVPIYATIFVGWLVRRLGWMNPVADSSFMKMAIDVSLPCFILFNMLGNEKLKSVPFSLAAISIGAAGMAGCLAIAWLASKALSLKKGDGQRTFIVTTGVHNYGFFIISMIAILYPDPSDPLLGLVFTHNVGCDLVFWSAGFLLISQASKFSFRMFARGPIVVVFAALLLTWTGAADWVPQAAKNTLKLIGGCAIPLNLFMFGNLLYDFGGGGEVRIKVIAAAVAVRMLAIPALFLAAAYFLNIDYALKELLVFQALAPCGVTAAVLAKHFGGFPKMSVHITIATCAAAIVTLPLWISIGFSMIGRE